MSLATGLKCVRCGAEYPLEKFFEGCLRCTTNTTTANLTVTYDYQKAADSLSRDTLQKRRPGVWKYFELLPVKLDSCRISLNEGGTPLTKCERLGERMGLRNLYVKDESRNPTWSFKDRLCCVAISKGLEFGAKTATTMSTGNHGASTAAYAAKAGMNCVIFTLPYVPKTMLTFMRVYGAKTVIVAAPEGYETSRTYNLIGRCVRERGWYPTGTYTLPPTGNPYGPEGYKTIAYEMCEQLNWIVPDKIIVPTGYGAGLSGIWKGIREFRDLGLIDGVPSMIAAESSSGAPLVNAMKKGLDYVETVPASSTIAVSIGSSTTSYEGLKSLKESKGTAVSVTDDEIMTMQRILASTEGMYAEPSSVASVAAAKKLAQEGNTERDEVIVCEITSGGLKDPDSTGEFYRELPVLEPDWPALVDFMKEHYELAI